MLEPHSFIVRIWFEAIDAEDSPIEMRGSIEDVGSHEMHYFSRLDSILAFIRKQLQIDNRRFRQERRGFFNRSHHGK